MRNITNPYVIYLNFFFTIFVYMYTYINIDSMHEDWFVAISILSLISLMIQLVSFKKMRFGVFDFIIYFFLFSHIFMFGNIYLLAIGKMEFIAWGLIHRYEKKLLFEAGLFVICYLQTVSLGAVFFTENKKNRDDFKQEKVQSNKLILSTGIITLLIATPFKLFIDFENIVAAQNVGSYYALQSKSGISDDLAILFVPAIIFILNSDISIKVKKKITIGFTLYSTLTMILTGDRRYQFIGILIVLLNYLYINKIKLKICKVIIVCISGIVGLNLLTQISEIRQQSLVSISTFFGEYWLNLLSFDFFYKILGEFGLSFMTIVISIKNIPTIIPYQNGLSFLGSIPSILPIGWIFPTFFYNVSIFRRLYEVEGYPVGASLPGELFANFGWSSLLLSFIIGGLIGKYFKFSNSKNPLKIAQYFSLFYILINIVRASFLEVTRNTFVVIFIPYLIYHFCKSAQRKHMY